MTAYPLLALLLCNPATAPGPRALACKECPPEAVFFACSQGKTRAEWVLQPGVASGFRLAGWRHSLTLAVKRQSAGRLSVTSVGRGPNGVVYDRTTVMAPGETIVWAPGIDLESAGYGASSEIIRCSWLE